MGSAQQVIRPTPAVTSPQALAVAGVGPATQPHGNAAAVDSMGIDSGAMTPIGDDLHTNQSRILGARMTLDTLLWDAVLGLNQAFAKQATDLLAGSVDHTIATLFGKAAGDVARGLIVTAGGAAGPIGAWFADALTTEWTRRVGELVTAGGPKGKLVPAAGVEEFFRGYAMAWCHAAYVASDAAMSSEDPTLVATTAETLTWLAYDPAGTSAALRTALLVPFLQAADRSGAGRRLADAQLTGLYNLKVVYDVAADGSVGRVSAIGLPTAVPESERPLLLDLLGVLEELPCQFVTSDGRVVADAGVGQPSKLSFVDPSFRRQLQLQGSDRGANQVDDLRQTAETSSDPSERASAEEALDAFVAAAVERHQAEIVESFASTTLRDAQGAGVRLLGLS